MGVELGKTYHHILMIGSDAYLKVTSQDMGY
jgi:hypothetical protein